MTEFPRILQLTGVRTACEQWRIWWPTAALKRLGYTCDYYEFDKLREIFDDVQRGIYDVIVTPRYVWTTISVRTPSGKRTKVWTGDNWRNQVSKYNLTWVYEADDDLWSIDSIKRSMEVHRYESKSERKIWLDRITRYRDDRIRLSPYVHGFTVSTEPLREVVAQYTQSPVYVIPNAVDVPSWDQMVRGAKRDIEPVTIGWAGGIRDESDLKVLAEAWHKVAEICPEVKFIVFGQQSETLCAAVPPDQLVSMPWCDMDDYPSLLVNFDIGCCALQDIDWNYSKSCVKWYEYSMSGAASVVSPTVYSREVTHDVDGIIATTVDEWVTALVRLVREPTLRKQFAANAKETVLNKHTTDQHAQKWMDAWVGIVEAAKIKNAA